MAYEILVAEEFWRRVEKVGDRGTGERLTKAIRKLRNQPRERGRLLAGVAHPVHGRIYRLRIGSSASYDASPRARAGSTS